jgi:hypothetical protein
MRHLSPDSRQEGSTPLTALTMVPALTSFFIDTTLAHPYRYFIELRRVVADVALFFDFRY